jgi:hypothetical protein
VQAALRTIFARWGLPKRMRVDNGAPWGSFGDLPPALALWLIGLGVEVIWNRPGHAQENGRVERTHGVIAQWAEPERCAGVLVLQRHVEWAIEIQREKYPAINGQSRSQAYPTLLDGARFYDPSQEEALWDLERVHVFLAQGVGSRRVSKVGRISLYNRDYPVGRPYARQDVSVRFDAVSREWVILDNQGDEIVRHAPKEISRERILALDVSRRK